MSSDDDFDFNSGSDYDEGSKKKVTKGKAAKKEPVKKETKKDTKAESKKAKKDTTPKKTKDSKPKETKAKKSPAKKKKRDSDDEGEIDTPPKKKRAKAAQDQDDRPYEEIYQKKTPLEHILLRPDTYIGSVEMHDQTLWVYDEGVGMNLRNIKYVPGLYKIFDEILVNAADNYQRDSSMNGLKVTIDPENNVISVWNNGQGIPVEIHAEHGVYIPEMIFGELLTSSNYDDKVKKVTGGRNGYGAKLTNIFSTEFTVETSHKATKRMLKQTFRSNMGKKEEPVITEAKENDFTKITFKPDLTKFKMTHLDEDIVALMTKRVYDIAGCNIGVKVWLNGKRLAVSSFKSYVDLYLKEGSKATVFDEVNDRWEVGVALTDGEFQQVSFVNSICTVRGGTHVEYVAKQVVKAVQEAASKKNKGGADIKPAYVKSHLWIFVRSLIENPAFDSQTKETLNTKISDFGSKCELSEDFLKKVIKSDIVNRVLQWSKFQENIQLGKKTAKKRGKLNIAKLDDANNAGGKHAKDCTLILTEGDSAKTQAVAGLGVVGRDNFGAFPLRGKLLNVREAAFQTISNNAEIENIVKILGLQIGQKYENTDSLRYGHLMIMTDQDYDGSHIKGLIINFIHYYWPSLLKIPGYVTEFITPIIKAAKGKQVQYFYTMPEFKEWMDRQGARHGWDIHYLKGLGSNTPAEFKHFFASLDQHRIDFAWQGEEDGEVIDMAFSRKRADERKRWMAEYKPGTFLDQTSGEDISYSDFVNKELILFSIADCERQIPSLVDGLKPSQRKVLYACFKRTLKKEIKVVQLAGHVMELCAYHHGEQSLHSTTIGMAQNFVGSNNINVLYPGGSFGSRIQGGDDAAAARYIRTRLSDITRAIFRVEDEPLLDYLVDEGKRIEPKWYIPIIPMVLVNGCSGIGMGWSTTIPSYNPREIVANIRRLLAGEAQVPMHPWYAGFVGTITPETDKKRYKVDGKWKRIDNRTIEITELPVGVWTQDYKNFLLEQMNPDKKKKDCILLKDIKEYHTEQTVHFEVESAEVDFPSEDAELEKMLKLSGKISISNMTLFDSEGRIRQWENVASILDEFYTLRLQYYDKRKDYMVDTLREEWKRLDNKVRFILAVVNKEIIISNRKKSDLLQELRDKSFDPFPPKPTKAKKTSGDEEVVEDEEGESSDDESDKKSKSKDKNNKDYDYLLSMSLWSLTLEKVQELVRQRDDKSAELKVLLATAAKQLWLKDLDELVEALDTRDAEILADQEATKGIKKKAGKLKPKGRAKKAKLEEGSDEDFAGAKPKPKAPKKVTPAMMLADKPAAKPKKEETTPKADTKKKPKDISSYFASPVAKEEDEENTPLAERLAKKGKPSPFKSTKSDGDDNEDESPVKETKKRKTTKSKTDEEVAPKKRATKSKAKAKDDDDDEDEEVPKKKTTKAKPPVSDDDKEEAAPKSKKAAAKKTTKAKAKDSDEDEPPKRKKAATKKPKATSDSEDDEEAAAVEKRTTRPGRGRNAVDYSKMFKDDEEEESDDGAESDVSLFSD